MGRNTIKNDVQTQLQNDILCSLNYQGISCLAATSRCKAVSLSYTFSWVHVGLLKPADVASPNFAGQVRSGPNA